MESRTAMMLPGVVVTWTQAPLPLLWLEVRHPVPERPGMLMSAPPFHCYVSCAAAASRAMLSSGRRAAARRCSNITIYRLISVSCSRNRSPAMLSM